MRLRIGHKFWNQTHLNLEIGFDSYWLHDWKSFFTLKSWFPHLSYENSIACLRDLREEHSSINYVGRLVQCRVYSTLSSPNFPCSQPRAHSPFQPPLPHTLPTHTPAINKCLWNGIESSVTDLIESGSKWFTGFKQSIEFFLCSLSVVWCFTSLIFSSFPALICYKSIFCARSRF